MNQSNQASQATAAGAAEPDRYAVIGNPIAHSKSPQIHAAFARQTGQDLRYEAVLAPLEGFRHVVREFAAGGGRGANVTVPFKVEAHGLASRLSLRAALAGAVNTLRFDGDEVFGDNTDGIGLVRDIDRQGADLAGKRVLVIGAGGAARGALGPLLERRPARVAVAARRAGKAAELARLFAVPIETWALADLPADSFDVVINATSASLDGAALELPAGLYARTELAYDMMSGAAPTPFMRDAAAHGARAVSDGLGMLVEQAAEAFLVWRGVLPATAPVLAQLRAQLGGA